MGYSYCVVWFTSWLREPSVNPPVLRMGLHTSGTSPFPSPGAIFCRLDYVPSKAAYVHYITKAYFTRFGDAHAGEDEEKVRETGQKCLCSAEGGGGGCLGFDPHPIPPPSLRAQRVNGLSTTG